MIIKEVPEDFVVVEKSSFKLGYGKYSIYKMKKLGLTTEEAVNIISRTLRTERKNIGYAGNKDKNALTKQFISIYGLKNPIDMNLKNLNLEFMGYTDMPISLGDLEGNYFVINVKKVNAKEFKNFSKKVKLKRNARKIKLKTINYYDEQRFSLNNYAIGKNLIQKKFKEAVELILEGNGYYEHNVREYIQRRTNDYVGALRLVPKKILMMYIHSVQSHLFNEAVSEFIKKKTKANKRIKYSLGSLIFPKNYSRIKQIKFPVFGFGIRIKDKKIKKIMENILKKEKIEERNFIIKSIPEISAEGSFRNLLVDAEDFSYNINNKNIVLKFFLKKGSYATILVKDLFS